MKIKVLLLALMLALTACTAGSQNSTINDQTLSITANARVPLTPDIAYITIGVHSSNADVAQAVDDNNQQINNVTQTLIDQFGILEADIQTANFNLWASDQYDSLGQYTGVLYYVDNTLYVTIRNLNDFGSILDEVVKSGANSIWGIQFDVADKSAALDQARAQAIENAGIQAAVAAQAAGLTLGEIRSIDFSESGSPAPFMTGMGGGGGGSDTVPISAGQLMVSVDVTITYGLNP